MRILILEALVSAVYVFDVSAYPFVHVPFYLLTLLYFGSILEIIGVVRMMRYVSRRLSNWERRHEGSRLLTLMPTLLLAA